MRYAVTLLNIANITCNTLTDIKVCSVLPFCCFQYSFTIQQIVCCVLNLKQLIISNILLLNKLNIELTMTGSTKKVTYTL